MAEIKISEVEYNKLLSQIDDLKNEVKMLKNEENVEKSDELVLSEDEQRYVIFPIKHDKFWEMYKKAESSFWTTEELDLSKDNADFEALEPNEQHFIKYI